MPTPYHSCFVAGSPWQSGDSAKLSALTADETAGRNGGFRTENAEASESFQKASRVLAFVTFTIVLLDFICVQNEIMLLTRERIALIGAVSLR